MADRKKRVLVLHSYHQGLEWTDNISRGIQSVISPFEKLYEVHYEYLDTKRNTDPAYIKQLTGFISEKHKHLKYELVIAADNNALELINNHSINFRDSPPIVFCGINHFSPELISNLDNVTGIIEAADHQANIEIMQKYHPTRKHIIIMLDRTPTGNAIRHEFAKVEKLFEDELEFEFLRDILVEEIPKRLSHPGKDSIIYLLSYNSDRERNFISYAEGIEIVNQSTDVPVYGAWDFYLGKGIVGGKLTSGFLQGEHAAKLALKILMGTPVHELPVITKKLTQYMFDYKEMERYGLNISSLPPESIVINKPSESFNSYKKYLFIFAALFLPIALLVLWKYRHQQLSLRKEHEQAIKLEKMVEERTQELEIANQELKRLSNLDGLTELFNRRYFDQALEREIKRLRRGSSAISLLMCDIDFFKNFNDSYGHQAGDSCIQSVANSIQECCHRVADVAARYGGEEFAIILPDTNAQGAYSIAECIRRKVKSIQIPHISSSAKNIVSVSIGVSTMMADKPSSASTLIARADAALYESKNNGRDLISIKNS